MKNNSIKKLVLMAMLSAVSYIIVALVRIPVVSFLKYEPKDVIITIGGFLYGPLSAAAISLVVSLLEMVTVSDTGIIGCIMNFLSTCSFACVAALIYKKRRTQAGAIMGLLAATLSMTTVMILWNWLITPLYLEVTRQVVEGMLLTVFLPFNLLKAGLNSALTLLIYKPVSRALRRAKLLPPSPETGKTFRWGVLLLAVAAAATCIVMILVLQGIL